ncbi:MAG: SPOR domain-containing protein [Nitrospirota bacterium]|jgi:cell division protein FtsN
MIREREKNNKAKLVILVLLLVALLFFVLGIVVNKWFWSKDTVHRALTEIAKEDTGKAPIAADKKAEGTKEAKNKNPIVGEEKEEFTFYKTLQNEKGTVPLKPQDGQKEKVREKVKEKEQDTGEKKEKKEVVKEEKKEKAKKKEQKKEAAIKKENVVKKEKARESIAAKEKRYTLQIAAFKEKDTAEELAGRLKKKGYDSYIVPVTISQKGVWFRVRVGRFETRPDAQSLQSKLKGKEGFNSFITFTTE